MFTNTLRVFITFCTVICEFGCSCLKCELRALKIQDDSLNLPVIFTKAGTKLSLTKVHDQNALSCKYEKENDVSICSAKAWKD